MQGVSAKSKYPKTDAVPVHADTSTCVPPDLKAGMSCVRVFVLTCVYVEMGDKCREKHTTKRETHDLNAP